MGPEPILRVHPIEVALDPPLVTAAGPVGARPGVLVELVDPDGTAGWGEASPLPGWGDDEPTTRTVLAGLDAPAALAGLAPGGTLDGHRFARAAVDVAWHDLVARRSGLPLWAHLGGRSPTVRVNALVDDTDPEAAARRAAAAVRAGHGCVKLKVASAAPRVDRERIRAVRDAVGEAVEIRLDANRGWDTDTAVEVLGAAADVGVRYCEEPVADPGDFAPVARRSGVPVGLDETLVGDVDVGALVDAGGIAALVCKVQPLGGVTPTLALATYAAARDLAVVVGAFVDTAVGARAAAHVAAAVAPDEAHGLALGARIRADVGEGLTLVDGSVDLGRAPGIGIDPDPGRCARPA